MLFDTHAHYDDESFDADRDAVLTALPEQGVGLILNPGCDVESSRKAVRYAAAYPHVYAAVGIHPENCGGCTAGDLDAIRALAQQPKTVAIGEIGLDYYWAENPPRDFQQQVLRQQLALARELALPVIIHDREAHADTLAIVREFPGVTGVFHCFSGSPEMARELLKMGWYLGFDGPVTYKNARRAPEVAAVTPLDRMLIETDSPYITPVPYRGRRNDSGYVHLVAEKLAEWKGVTPEEMARVTTENGKRLFRIP
jgi:TatD DNase family protein